MRAIAPATRTKSVSHAIAFLPPIWYINTCSSDDKQLPTYRMEGTNQLFLLNLISSSSSPDTIVLHLVHSSLTKVKQSCNEFNK